MSQGNISRDVEVPLAVLLIILKSVSAFCIINFYLHFTATSVHYFFLAMLFFTITQNGIAPFTNKIAFQLPVKSKDTTIVLIAFWAIFSFSLLAVYLNHLPRH